MDYDLMTAAEPPRKRRLLGALAMFLPVVIVAAGAAWFVRVFVAPPSIAIPEAPLLASADSTPAPEPPPPPVAAVQKAEPTPEPVRETTGNSAPPPTSSPWSLPMIAGLPGPGTSIWPPAGTAARAPQDTAPMSSPTMSSPEMSIDASEPIAGPIPLPHPRPRISTAIARGNVPLPRPRPTGETD